MEDWILGVFGIWSMFCLMAYTVYKSEKDGGFHA